MGLITSGPLEGLTLFHTPQRCINKVIDSARKALICKFAPLHLDLEHISSQHHPRVLAKALFTNGEHFAIVVAGGTCIYIEKSSNCLFQRHTFSIHKGTPLGKSMVLVSPNGYILEINKRPQEYINVLFWIFFSRTLH